MKRASNRIQRNQTCAFERLEERQHFSVYTVTNANDSGAGSLRQAILNVNADKGTTADTIKFSIGTGAQTINLKSALPIITHGVVIGGSTQPGYSGTPLITLKVSGAAVGLALAAPNSDIDNLSIIGGSTGIEATGNGETIQENEIKSTSGTGIDLLNSSNDFLTYNLITSAGSQSIHARGASTGNEIDYNSINKSGDTGIELDSASKDNQIENDTIENGLQGGIVVESDSNTIEENYVGGNALSGIDVSGSHNTISQNSVDGNGGGLSFEGYAAGPSTYSGGNYNSVTLNTVEYNKTEGVTFNDVHNDVFAQNTVAMNDGFGVTVLEGIDDTISQNQIFGNTQAGISLEANGDHDQPAPELDQSVYHGTETDVTGKLLGPAKTTYTVEFFGNPLGGGQGNVYLGSATVKTNAKGYVLFTEKLQATTSPGETVTATATSTAGDTSIFSNAVIGQAYTNPLLKPVRPTLLL